jgi:hypothetical protein
MNEFEALYQRYVDEYSTNGRYVNGAAEISEEDLMEQLETELDDIRDEYGSIDEFAEPDEPRMIINCYSMNEAKVVYEHLRRLRSIGG